MKNVDDKLNAFVCETELQRAREALQKQAFQNVKQESSFSFLLLHGILDKA